MTKSLSDIAEEYREKLGLSPYAHELNPQGTDCADDCPACQWAKQQSSPSSPK